MPPPIRSMVEGGGGEGGGVPMDLKAQVSCLAWVLGLKLSSSTRPARVLSY